MSFSGEIKEDLSRARLGAVHCRVAEASAIYELCGNRSPKGEDKTCLTVQTENLPVARKYFTLLKKTFNIRVEFSVRQNMGRGRSRVYTVYVPDQKETAYAASCLKDASVTQRVCCKRAFLRGAFLAVGSISDPNKAYHLEFVCMEEEKAKKIQSMLQVFDLDAKMILRKKYYVVYLKEGDRIVDALNVMEAHQALMELENVRILKDMRNTVNRKVNCETANLGKTVSAAVKQIEDIKYIEDHTGFGNLSEALAQMAEVRLANPDASLKELGMMMTPQVGKSGVNHRLRKLSEMADALRNDKEEKQL